MADRHRLHISKFEDFKAWLLKDGWDIEEPKGTWEVLRARKLGRKKSSYCLHKNGCKRAFKCNG